MRRFGKYFAIVTLAVGIGTIGSGPADAQIIRDSLAELQGIGVEEHLGDYVPMDLVFTDDRGDGVRLGDYFNRGKPVLLVLAYYECPMLCHLVLNGVVGGVKDLSWEMGEGYQIVTVSINPAEGHELAAAKKINYLEAAGESGTSRGWDFLTGDSTQSRALANAVGFQYYYDEEQKQYAHPAVIYLLAEDGKITRYLYGIEYKPHDLKLGLLEASEGKIGNTLDRIILYCYHYDPDSKGYVVFATNVMRLGGLLTVALLGALLIVLWRREHRRRVRHRTVPTGHRM